jgi:hypothetical protein
MLRILGVLMLVLANSIFAADPLSWKFILQDGSECRAFTAAKPMVSYGRQTLVFDYGCNNLHYCHTQNCGIGFTYADIHRSGKEQHVLEYIYVRDKSTDFGWRVAYTKSVKIVKMWD